MLSTHLRHLCCPQCRASLELTATACEHGSVTTGELKCVSCNASYPIVRSVPRFVASDNYAAGFGFQWRMHSRAQLDAITGLQLTEDRFFHQSRWPRHLDGEMIIEAGSGAGRFTTVAAATGATILSFDYSEAADVNFEINGDRENVLIVQADVYRIPFVRADRVFCFGVLQHTPDPSAAFASLLRAVKPGGALAADIYLKSFGRYVLGTKYWVRPFTKGVGDERLHEWTRRYIETMWPLACRVALIPKVGRRLSWKMLVPYYGDLTDDEAMLREWALLDAYDMLAPRYDLPQTESTVRRWGVGLADFEVERCPQGLVMRGTKVADGR